MRSCPRCGADRSYELETRAVLKCASCGRQFSERHGTVREGSKLPRSVWDRAESLFGSGLSARQVASILGVQYRTAWRLGRLISIDPRAGSRA